MDYAPSPLVGEGGTLSCAPSADAVTGNGLDGGEGSIMDLYAVLDQVVALLRQRQHVTYRALKVQFQLDDEALEALRDELIEAQRLAAEPPCPHPGRRTRHAPAPGPLPPQPRHAVCRDRPA